MKRTTGADNVHLRTDNAALLHTTLGLPSKKATFEILTYLDIENDNPFVWIVV